MEICLLRQVLRRLVYAPELKWIITGGSFWALVSGVRILGQFWGCGDVNSLRSGAYRNRRCVKASANHYKRPSSAPGWKLQVFDAETRIVHPLTTVWLLPKRLLRGLNLKLHYPRTHL